MLTKIINSTAREKYSMPMGINYRESSIKDNAFTPKYTITPTTIMKEKCTIISFMEEAFLKVSKIYKKGYSETAISFMELYTLLMELSIKDPLRPIKSRAKANSTKKMNSIMLDISSTINFTELEKYNMLINRDIKGNLRTGFNTEEAI
jgi:hypothetical protein